MLTADGQVAHTHAEAPFPTAYQLLVGSLLPVASMALLGPLLTAAPARGLAVACVQLAVVGGRQWAAHRLGLRGSAGAAGASLPWPQ